ncbi:MAG: alanyl-tRNA editing protein [Candidatus Marsarchaeota archaeon]|jgi:misacylated tRNA(Ala) deacylase|nr:alanyl-tRNA editing protein [Candidatus Marsarchaeota archaeon]MCL5418612.1 alanyl-tRNA editing protein [Candidatus Marsarchaeota archaeon]
MTNKIYLSDSYVREIDAIITGVQGSTITLDKTIFYPTGGGQPCDTGIIGIYKVVDVKKDGDEVAHVLETGPGFGVGDTVHCAIDWDKRYMHMRLHTALHIIDGVVEKLYQGRITGGQIYDDRARMDFDVPGLDRAKAMEIMQSAQKIVSENHKVSAKLISKEEAKAIPNLARTEPGEDLLSKLDTVRIIDIEGFDFQLDGGTHVASTGEVGTIELTKYENKGSHNKRIEIMLR